MDQPSKKTMFAHLLITCAVVLGVGAPTACDRTQTPVNWPELVECGPGVSDLIGIVTEVLLGDGDVRTELDNLARTNGTETVVCVVERLRSDWSAPGASATPQRAKGVDRADAFLTDVGTKFGAE